jgi:hypothetical protein
MGRIELDICFSDSSNYRKEKLEFEVMDLPSQYHAILGRPAFAKFMAVPHYAYLTLKIRDQKEPSQYKEVLKYPTHAT